MKKYISILLAAVLCSSILAGCGGSGNSGQKPAGETQKQATQTEGTEEARPTEDAAQTGGTEEARPSEDAAQADVTKEEARPSEDTAQDSTQAAADDTVSSGDYLVFVKDAETMAPIPDARVQFCSDSLCQMGKTDESGLASFHSEDPGTYTVHMMKAPDGYVKSEEEVTLDKDNCSAVYLLDKEGAESQTAEDSVNTESTESDMVLDLPLTGFTFNAPEEFKHVLGEIRINDVGEVSVVPDVVAGYVGYQAKTAAEFEEYVNSIGVSSVDDMTDENIAKLQEFYAGSPNLVFFRVMGVRGDRDLDEIKKKMFDTPILVCDEIGTAGDYKFYYVVLDDESEYEELRNTDYPQDKLEEAYKFWQEAATTSNFKDRITVKEPASIYPDIEDGAAVSFETQDLEGNPVTSQELLAGHKITMINIWATWCSNCKAEMEDLEALNKEWADLDCQIIGICDDAKDEEMVPLAKKILEEHGVTFRNVRSNDVICDEQLPAVGLPTSYFVDSEGKILCSPIVGRNVEQYSVTLQELLSEME